MSHITGTIQVLATPLVIHPGTTPFNPAPAPGGTKLLMLHFQNLALLPGDELRVPLGYDTDVFTAADGPGVWTRPIDVHVFPSGIDIAYVAAGPTTGSAQLDQFARGERLPGESGHPSFSNCDPFYQPPAYLEPTYDPFWYCSDPPHWDNSAAVTDPTDVRARVARSVGMIVSVERPSPGGPLQVSTCSVTLVDGNRVITAGHCHQPAEALNSSVTFDYQTLADGSRPPGYSPRFYKVKRVIGHTDNGTATLDFSLLELAEAPPGIPAIQLRHSLPFVGEAVFGVHHPNGAVKKLSPPHAAFSEVTASSSGGIEVPRSFHVSGGSSGSGLFDAAGRILGVLSRGNPCAGGALQYCPVPNILQALVPTPPPPVARDVMIVLDHSGSMALDDGTGRPRIDAARDAVSLFVQLVRTGGGNRLGLVAFSTTASTPFGLTGVTAAGKTSLIGAAPFSAGIVGGITPTDMTSIGHGLQVARSELGSAGANPRAILLMTDGLQNTPPSIADAEGSLDDVQLHAIGFGGEASLDAALLSSLAAAHSGQFLRAGGGLALEKFFSSAFGNIFESGVLFDPEFDLPANQPGAPIPFNVCGEDTITVVAGWDRNDTDLRLELTTPGGNQIFASTAGVEDALGRTWTFLRVPLPIGGERNGTWSARVLRPGGGGEFPPPAPALRYFVNVIPSGGPRLTRVPSALRLHYTGDRLNPRVILRYPSGDWPLGEVSMTVTRPNASIGTILGRAGLGAASMVSGDRIPARQATLQALEAAAGAPLVRYVTTDFDLSAETEHNDGTFEEDGCFGRVLEDFLNIDGSYTFHAKARYGEGCPGTREHVWSVHVDVGIDGDHTPVTVTDLPPGGATLTFTPQDRYGNLVGPGRGDGFTVGPAHGSTPLGPVIDLGNGSYQVNVSVDPDSLAPPSVTVAQPGRDPVTVGTRGFELYVYSVTFVCGEQADTGCCCASLRPGRYSTEINIHNPRDTELRLAIRPLALVLAGAARGREPGVSVPTRVTKASSTRLPPHSATMVDCCRLDELLLGAPAGAHPPITSGVLEILSTGELEVTAVYSAANGGTAPALDVRRVGSRIIKL